MVKHVPSVCTAILAAVAVGPVWGEVVTNESAEINTSTFVSCANGGAGEVVNLAGPLHTLITFTINGNHVSGKLHFQPQGLSGTGLITGDIYQAVGVTQDIFSGSMINGRYSETFVNNFRIVGHGPGNNFTFRENYHLTFSASGIVSSFHDNFSTDCK